VKRFVWIATGVVLSLTLVIVAFAFLVKRHQHDVAAEAERARIAALRSAAVAEYKELRALDSRFQSAFVTFSESKDAYDGVLTEAGQASRRRHDLFNENPSDAVDLLGYASTEVSAVEQLQKLSEAKADAARAVAASLGEHYGEAVTSSLLKDISNASEPEGKGLVDWWRGAHDVADSLTARINGRWYLQDTGDVSALYRASDEQMAASRSRWDTITSQMLELEGRLKADMAKIKTKSGATDAVLGDTNGGPSLAAPKLSVTFGQASEVKGGADVPTGSAAVEAPSAAESPLTAGSVSSLVRATSAIRVATRTNGRTYITVPETPAEGTVNRSRLWTGRIADGRWVGIVPLESGGPTDVVYALMWVWNNGQADFVGEIPAENDGLGHLTMAVTGGEIELRWPVYGPNDPRCCPSLERTKHLTLDRITLRLLSDTTIPKG
jgi:hypothetical protein